MHFLIKCNSKLKKILQARESYYKASTFYILQIKSPSSLNPNTLIPFGLAMFWFSWHQGISKSLFDQTNFKISININRQQQTNLLWNFDNQFYATMYWIQMYFTFSKLPYEKEFYLTFERNSDAFFKTLFKKIIYSI